MRLDCSFQVVALLFEDLGVVYHGFLCEAENEFRFARLDGRGGREFSDDLGQVDGPSRFKRCVRTAAIGLCTTVIGLCMTVIGLGGAVSAQVSIWGWG